jgi:hypothetical protein
MDKIPKLQTEIYLIITCQNYNKKSKYYVLCFNYVLYVNYGRSLFVSQSLALYINTTQQDLCVLLKQKTLILCRHYTASTVCMK